MYNSSEKSYKVFQTNIMLSQFKQTKTVMNRDRIYWKYQECIVSYLGLLL